MNFVGRLGLQHRITLSVALGLCVLLLVLAYAALWALQESADAALGQRALLAQTEASHVDDVVLRAYEILVRTATLSIVDPEAADVVLVKQVLQETQSEMGTSSKIFWLDKAGNVLRSEPDQQGMVGSNLLSHPGVFRAIKSGEPAITELPAPPNELPQICLAVPIRRGSGALAGVLTAEISPMDRTFRLVPRLRAGDPTSTELVNGEGVVVASSYDVEGVRRSGHAALLSDLRRATVMVHEEASSRKHIVAYAPLATLPSWGVIVEQPEDVVLTLPTRLRQQIVIVGILAVLAGALLAWFYVRRAVAPLGLLTAAAVRMGDGDLNSPIAVQREDEIGVLSKALETMRSKLKDSLEERQRWNYELERRVEQRTKELAGLLEAAEGVSATLDPNKLWDVILTQAKHVCPTAEAGLLMAYEKHTNILVPKASFGSRLENVNYVELQPGDLVLQRVVHSGNPILIESDGAHEYDEGLAGKDLQCLRPMGKGFESVRRAIIVPLIAKRATLGCLVVCSSQEASPLTHNDLRLLQAFAVQAATAIENASLYEEVQHKDMVRGSLLAKLLTAQEEERRRIARELHDESAQALTALMMAVESAEEALPQLAEAQKQRLDRAKGLIARALGDVRRLIWDLRPTVLDDLGLAPAVRWFAEEHLEHVSIDIDVRASTPQRRLPTTIETEVYRVLQEAITNVARHARASHLRIQLGQSDGLFVAIVEDDGTGFDVDNVGRPGQQRGLGLLGMQERASLLGGSVAIESCQGKGTRLTLSIPV